MTKTEAEQISITIKRFGISTVIGIAVFVFTVGGYVANLQAQVSNIRTECTQALAAHITKEIETFRLYDERIDGVKSYNKELLEEVKQMRQELKEVYQILTSRRAG